MSEQIAITDEHRDTANLVIQSAIAAHLLLLLARDKNIQDEVIKRLDETGCLRPEFIQSVKGLGGFGNFGTLLMVLYSLVVIPKETIDRDCAHSIKDVNDFLAQKVAADFQSDYHGELNKNSFNFFRHLRNAVSHGNVELSQPNNVTFSDEDKRNGFRCAFSFSLEDMGEICHRLLSVTQCYIDFLSSKTK